jgi:hypothetical protein
LQDIWIKMDEIGKVGSTRCEVRAISKILVRDFREVLEYLGLEQYSDGSFEQRSQKLIVIWIQPTPVLPWWQAFFPSC